MPPQLATATAEGLKWLLHPVTPEEFLSDYWEHQALVVSRGQPAYFRDLITLEDVDHALSGRDRRYPEVVLKNARASVTAADYMLADRTLDVPRVCSLFAEGSTITLAFLDRVLPALARICRSLAIDLSAPIQANVYLTPAHAQGAHVHYDTHDVLVLQIQGSKRWTLYDSPLRLPLPGQDFDPAAHRPGAVFRRFELNPGDLVYIPRGVMHDAQSTDALSMHVTLGILRYTWTELLLEHVARAALKNPCFRESLPPGFARNGFSPAAIDERLQALMDTLRHSCDGEAMLNHFAERFIADTPPLFDGLLRQWATAAPLDDEVRLSARPGVAWRIVATAAGIDLVCFRRRISLPDVAGEAVEFALRNRDFVIADLPGPLDRAGRITLLERLLAEGLLTRHRA